MKRELPRLAQLAEKVVNRHGATKLELPIIAAALGQLDNELTQHLTKEETVLFPYVTSLEQSASWQGPKPQSCFGTVANPIAMMSEEHDAAGSLIAEIRRLTRTSLHRKMPAPLFMRFTTGLENLSRICINISISRTTSFFLARSSWKNVLCRRNNRKPPTRSVGIRSQNRHRFWKRGLISSLG